PVPEQLAADSLQSGAHPSREPSARSHASTEERGANKADALSASRIVGIALGGGGLVAAGIGIGFGIRALSKQQDAEEYCDGNKCDPTGLTLRKEAIAAGDTSTVFVITGLALAGGGVALALANPFSRATRSARAVAIAPALGGALMHGGF